MKEEDIRLIKQEIKNNRKAGECGLASNNEKFEWAKTADALEKLLDYITNLQEENEGLRLQKDNNYEMAYDYNLKIKEATEYLTSYDSINELMRYETSKDNKGLDRKTMIEMDRRYTIIHHKLLEILQGKSDE